MKRRRLTLNFARPESVRTVGVLADLIRNYDPNEARDPHGEWTTGGGSAGASQSSQSPTQPQLPNQQADELTAAHVEAGKVKEIKPGVNRVETEKGTVAVKQRDTSAKGAKYERQISEMAQVAGVQMPKSREMIIHGKPAVVTDWAHGRTMNDMTPQERTDFLSKVPKEQIDKHILFDYLAGHGDTHNGNFIAGQDGNLHAIDKELWGHNGGWGEQTRFDIPEFVADMHKGYDTMHTFDPQTLQGMIDAGHKMAAHPGIDPKDAKGIQNRIAVLQSLQTKAKGQPITTGDLWEAGQRGVPSTGKGFFGKIKAMVGG